MSRDRTTERPPGRRLARRAAVTVVGLGLVWNPKEQLYTEFFYGKGFGASNHTKGRGLQGHGIHFRFSLASF